MSNFRFFAITVAAVGLVAAGCASVKIEDTKRQISAARPCCSSLQSLPQPAPFQGEAVLDLGPTSPHFDLGYGLAPFGLFHLKVPGSFKSIEVLSTAQPSRKMDGGDGAAHYVDARIVFFDANMGILKDVSGSPVVSTRVHGALGAYKLTRSFEVPPTAFVFAVTSDANAIGHRVFADFGESTRTIPVAGVYITRPNGRVTEYTMSTPYGEVTVLGHYSW